MNTFVLGKRYSGKTPFSIKVAAKTGLQHIEAGNWLRAMFETSDYALMLMDHELMERIVQEELATNSKGCLHFVQSKMEVGRPALVDGLFAKRDFLEVFDPDKDQIVELVHSSRTVNPDTHERELDDILAHVSTVLSQEKLDPARVHRYTFTQFRRDKGQPDVITPEGEIISVSSLDAAIGDFVQRHAPASVG